MNARTEAITDAGSSIVEYERWLQCDDTEILVDLESSITESIASRQCYSEAG